MLCSQKNTIIPYFFGLKKCISLSVFLLCAHILFAQFQVQTAVKESRCSASGQISLTVTGGTAPYSYQIVGSTVPPQTDNTFNALPPAAYQIRITDAVGANMVVSATVLGNYQAPTVQCVVNGSTVTLTTLNGRLPLRYATALFGSQTFGTPQSSSVFNCLPNGTHNFRVYDSCENFHTTQCFIDVKPLVDTVSCESVNGKMNITTKGFSGGEPPYSFTVINNLGDTFRNTTGNFSQLRGCTITHILSDKCQKLQKQLVCSTLKGYVKCANFLDQTASLGAEGGLPPYQFQSLQTNVSNTTGIFSNLPTNTESYQFKVTDACGAYYFFDVSKMSLFRVVGGACPSTGKFQVEMSQNIPQSDSCPRCSSFFPYRFNCIDCVPPRIVVDSNVSHANPALPFADFSPQPPGVYTIIVKNSCGDSLKINAEVKLARPKLTLSFDCSTNKITASTNIPGSTYNLVDSLGRLLATNTTGIFDSPYSGVFNVTSNYPLCNPASDTINTRVLTSICYGKGSKINPNTGVCEFKWILNAQLQTQTNYQLTGGPNNINVTNRDGIFKDLEPNSTYILKTSCRTDTIKTNPPDTPNLSLQLITPCALESNLVARGGRTIAGCLQNGKDEYVLLDSVGTVIGNNFTGFFTALKLGNTYQMRLKTLEGCYIQSSILKTTAYQRPVLTASYGVICAPGQTTGNIRFILRGGISPFNVQITNSPNVAAPIITNQNTGLFTNLPPGNYTLRAFDSCGISSDYATSVGPLNFTPQYNRACDGKLSLEVPFIDSAIYKWTNSADATLGTNRILELRDTTAQTYTINITTPQPCSFTNSINIGRFSPVTLKTNAGNDFVVSGSTANLRAQALAQGQTGRWRQINPSSGTTSFGNANSPNTTITVSDVPGAYTYVWELTDATGSCTVTDTVIATFCSALTNLNTNIVVTPTACKKTIGKASVTVTNATTPLTYLWSNGKTVPSVDSLAAGTYTVTISSSAVCSPPRVDTVVIKESFAVPPRTIDTVLCAGTGFQVGTKIYTQTGNYKDTLRSVTGCDSIINANLRFNRVPLENLGIIHQLNAKYCGDSLALNSKGDTSALYQWRWQNVPCSSCVNPRILPLSTPVYFVTITDKTTKCTAKDSVKVEIEGGFTERVPNAFTPNDDGVNDVFNVIPDNCIKIVQRLRIYNRWGNLVFDKTNLLPQKNEGWTGLDKTTPLASDVYAFVMEIEFVDGTTKKVTGEVNLVR